MFRCIFVVLSAALFSIVVPAIQAEESTVKPSDIPAEAFAALPGFERPRLSPSGKKLAFFIGIGGRRNLIVQNSNGTDRIFVPPQEKINYQNFHWKTDDMLVLQLGMTTNRWGRGSKTSEVRMISFNIPKRKFRWLGRPNSRGKNERASQYDKLIDLLPNEPNHVLLEMDFEMDGTPGVYKVDLTSGRRKMVQGGRKNTNDWYADQNSKIRLGNGYTSRSAEFNIRYKTSAGEWIDLKKLDWTEKYTFEDFAQEDDMLYVSGLSQYGTKGILKLNALTGEIQEEVLALPNHDISAIYKHPVTNKIAGAYYTDDYSRIHYFDEDLAFLQRSLNKAMPNTVNRIVSKALNKELYLVLVRSDQNPGDYFLYQRAKRDLAYIMSEREYIDERLMASTQVVSIPVRDGSEIPGYLTLPKVTILSKLPAVILPHGGPFGIRDSAEWDYEAQFYASRGYLVLKPNFRGSGGYGPAYENTGKLQWGGLMQDDVTDATNWLIREGMADPERICIVGSSYGGYAALMGVIKEPSLYKCAVSVNGVTDLPRLRAGDRKYIGGRAWIKNMGMKGAKDKSVSPYHRAKDINVPVLLISSKDDARIPYRHSKDLHNRLKKLKKSSQYVKIKNGTHHMITAESRLLSLQAAEKFLAEHIGQ